MMINHTTEYRQVKIHRKKKQNPDNASKNDISSSIDVFVSFLK